MGARILVTLAGCYLVLLTLMPSVSCSVAEKNFPEKVSKSLKVDHKRNIRLQKDDKQCLCFEIHSLGNHKCCRILNIQTADFAFTAYILKTEESKRTQVTFLDSNPTSFPRAKQYHLGDSFVVGTDLAKCPSFDRVRRNGTYLFKRLTTNCFVMKDGKMDFDQNMKK